MSRRQLTCAFLAGAFLAGALLVGACRSEQVADTSIATLPMIPPLLERITADRPAPVTDTVEVWVCDVPSDTTADLYGRLPLRQPLTPDGVVDAIGARVTSYFESVSNGRYRLTMVAGGTVAMSAEDDADDCVDVALDRSSPTADSVLAVATAEHVEGSPGGWGRPGLWSTCTGSCPAARTRRAAYVGASDFHPDWGEVPLLDLIQHEIGHTLGLPHSGSSEPGSDEYLSALDLMSDSAAPRTVDPDRRDAPDLIGVSRLDLGWLDMADVFVARAASLVDGELTAVVVPASSAAGTKLLVLPTLPVDTAQIVTIEYLVPEGFNDHLREAGVAVHLIDDRAGGGTLRVQQTIGTPPFTDLLAEGETLDVGGWSISVERLVLGATPQVTVRVETLLPGGAPGSLGLAADPASR